MTTSGVIEPVTVEEAVAVLRGYARAAATRPWTGNLLFDQSAG